MLVIDRGFWMKRIGLLEETGDIKSNKFIFIKGETIIQNFVVENKIEVE